MKPERTQIIATIGPSCSSRTILASMFDAGMDIARLNFSWGTHSEHATFIETLRSIRPDVPIIQDLSGPRIQHDKGHSFDSSVSSITDKDYTDLAFGIEHSLSHVALSFVQSANDINEVRSWITTHSPDFSPRIISKIERHEAVEAISEILDVSDAIMIARGDLGEAFPLEQLPGIQDSLISSCNSAGIPVIVATEMLASMVTKERPTRAEVTDIHHASLIGADAVMLSDETAVGEHPVEAVSYMQRIIDEVSRTSPSRTSLPL